MIRVRRLPSTRVLRRPRYEVEFGADPAHPDGRTVVTTTPATLIDTEIGVAEAWNLVRAADDAWTAGTGAWVGALEPAAETAEDGTSTRHFELWEYSGGHGLLIRSPRSPLHPTTIDLIFEGVEYLACARELDGFEVVRAEPGDLARLPEPASTEGVFVLVSGGSRHLVVASSLRMVEHAGDPSLSPFRPAPFSGQWWSGLFSGNPPQ